MLPSRCFELSKVWRRGATYTDYLSPSKGFEVEMDALQSERAVILEKSKKCSKFNAAQSAMMELTAAAAHDRNFV